MDLESHNGVRLNGEQVVGSQPLRSGDVVTLGTVTLVFHCGDRGLPSPLAELVHAAGDALRLMDPAGQVGMMLSGPSLYRLPLGERAVLVADSAMVGLFELLRRLAPSPLPVLIHGETGSGKEHAAVTAPGPIIEPSHLPASLRQPEPAAPEPAAPQRAGEGGSAVEPPSEIARHTFRPLAEEVRELERQRILEALVASGGVQTRAAQLIGMPLRTFTFKLKQYKASPRGR